MRDPYLILLVLLVCAFHLPGLLTGSPQWDGVDVHYSAQQYLSESLRAGRLPFWTPYVFSGFPFLADLQVGAWYPLNWPFFLAGVTPASIGQELLLSGLIACLGAYALALRLIGQPPAAMAAALAYGLSGYFAAHSQHLGMVQTAAWLPWLLLALDLLAARISPARLALAGLLGAALALPGHFQAALYAFCGAGLWAMAEAAWQRSPGRARRSAAALLAVGGWGALLAAVMILPGLELLGRSMRTQLDPAAYTDVGYFVPESLRTLVQPDYFGLLSGSYSGPGDKTQHYFYAGLATVPLAVLGLGQARVVRMAALLALPFVWYAVGPAGGLFRLLARLPGFHNVELPMNGWFLAALGLALLGGAGLARLRAWLRRWPRLSAAIVTLLLAGLFVDLLVFNALRNPLAYSRTSFQEQYGQPSSALADLHDGRLYGPPEAAVGYRNHGLQSRIETTYGYNPLELRAYAEYAEAAEANPRLIDALAATHRLQDEDVLPNPTALPLAFFARQVRAVPDTRAALAELDPARVTLVDDPLAIAPDSEASVSVLARNEDSVTLHYRAAAAGLLRLAIPFYPGWQATLHGAPLATLTVDHALLGVLVPPGEGDLRVFYAPRLFGLGAAISLLALAGAAAALTIGRR